MKFRKKGFTLIELLIVIALLGALAVGLLAALDPFDQLKKGTDTGVRNTVSEIQGGVVRYYAIKNAMPWGATTYGPSDASTSYSTAISPIVDAGELKKDFSTLAKDQLPNIRIIGTSETVTVCFSPKSKAIRSDPNTKFDSTGADVSCTGDVSSPTFSCYWCVK